MNRNSSFFSIVLVALVLGLLGACSTTQQKNEMRTVNQSVGRIEASVNTLTETVRESRDALNGRLNDVDQKVSTVQVSQQDMLRRVNTLEGRQYAADVKIEDVSRRVDRNEKRLDRIEAARSNTENRIVKAERRVGQVSNTQINIHPETYVFYIDGFGWGSAGAEVRQASSPVYHQLQRVKQEISVNINVTHVISWCDLQARSAETNRTIGRKRAEAVCDFLGLSHDLIRVEGGTDDFANVRKHGNNRVIGIFGIRRAPEPQAPAPSAPPQIRDDVPPRQAITPAPTATSTATTPPTPTPTTTPVITATSTVRYSSPRDQGTATATATATTVVEATGTIRTLGDVVVREGNQEVKLEWTNPTSEEFSLVRVVRRDDAQVPATFADGASLNPSTHERGARAAVIDKNVVNGTCYYYYFYVFYEDGSMSGPTQYTACPASWFKPWQW